MILKRQDKLAGAIFKQQYPTLDMQQQAFVDFHAGEYAKYARKVSRMFRQVLNREKLGNHDYAFIMSLYCDRLSPENVQEVIRSGQKNARKTNSHIRSIGWFRLESDKTKKIVKGIMTANARNLDFTVDIPWFFEIYKRQKDEGAWFKYHPWQGWQERPDNIKQKIKAARNFVHMMDKWVRELEKIKHDIMQKEHQWRKGQLKLFTTKGYKRYIKNQKRRERYFQGRINEWSEKNEPESDN